MVFDTALDIDSTTFTVTVNKILAETHLVPYNASLDTVGDPALARLLAQFQQSAIVTYWI